MTLWKKLAKTLGPLILWIAVADVVGVAASFFFDIMPFRGASSLLFYTLWCVLGVFVGLFSYNQAGASLAPEGPGDWSARPEAAPIGRFVLLAFVLFVALLLGFGAAYLWRVRTEPSYFVPDSEPLTFVFCTSVLLASVVAHTIFRPSTQSRT